MNLPWRLGSELSRLFPACPDLDLRSICVHALKYPPATLVQSVALALAHQLLEQAPHCLDSIHEAIHLGKFSPGKRSPALGSPSDVAETKEQLPDFTQSKIQFTRALNDCQAIKHGGIVASLATLPLRRWKQANPLVVANRRGPKLNLTRHLRNRELSHGVILTAALWLARIRRESVFIVSVVFCS